MGKTKIILLALLEVIVFTCFIFAGVSILPDSENGFHANEFNNRYQNAFSCDKKLICLNQTDALAFQYYPCEDVDKCFIEYKKTTTPTYRIKTYNAIITHWYLVVILAVLFSLLNNYKYIKRKTAI